MTINIIKHKGLYTVTYHYINDGNLHAGLIYKGRSKNRAKEAKANYDRDYNNLAF